MSKTKCLTMFTLAFVGSVCLFAASSGEHIEFLSIIVPEECPECDIETLVSEQAQPLTPAVGTPPVAAEVVSLFAHVRDDQYCVLVIAAFGITSSETCVNPPPSILALLPDIGPIELVEVPGERVEATAAVVSLAIRFIEARLHQRVSSSFGLNVWEPVDFGDPDEVAWYLENGGKVTLDLDVVLRDDSGVIGTVSTQVPLVGQAVRAALKTAGN